MATIGQTLTAPESGWKRYDDTDNGIMYNGPILGSPSDTDWYTTVNSNYYNGSAVTTRGLNKKIRVNFIGTKIRVINAVGSNRTTNAKIRIDNELESFSLQSPSLIYQTLVYEKFGLENKIHTLEIESGTDGEITLQLDAIDIDANGRLLHPDEVTDIKDLDLGKRIRCHYSTISNQVGTFSGFGKETADSIPVASTATPNGDFYFIMVEDFNKKKILVADRNIQNNISWDILNSSGIGSGSGLPWIVPDSPSNVAFTIRLLTGGTSATDNDNEWDKYIVNSTLNGTITAGDNNVWNWSGGLSWTSTVAGHATNRVMRGSTSVENWSTFGSNAVNTRHFRPVLEIKSLQLNKSFILFNGEYKKFGGGVAETPSIDLIPKMTSANTPSGIVSASSITSNIEPWGAFDKGRGAWVTNVLTGWLAYEFSEPQRVVRYAITNQYGAGTSRNPRSWTFEGWNGVSWDILDTQIDYTSWIDTIPSEFSITNNKSYMKYRINSTLNNGNTSYLSIGEMEMYGASIPATPPSWETVSTTLPDADTFINEGMDDLSVFDRKSTIFTIPMDDNTLSGEVLGSGRMFKERIDLKKYIDIEKIIVK
ncbi:MAG: hypothetical protein ACQEXX_02030 [Bacillota bacterium]